MTHWTRLSLSTRRQFLALAGLAGASTVIGASPSPRRLLDAGEGNHWVGVHLQGTACNRDAIGATISWSANGKTRTRFKSNGESYLSSHDTREVLGLGTATAADWIEIKWPPPSGRVERIANPPIDRYITIVEGKGRIG